MSTTLETQFENVSDMVACDIQNTTTYALHELPDRMLAPMIFVGFLSVVGIPGNILILLVFGLKHKSSVYRTIIITMAVYDLLVCTVTLPFEFYNLYKHLTFKEKWICKIFRTLNYFFVFNSSTIIHLLAVDRFRRVCRPLKKQMSLRMVIVCIAIIGFLSLILTIPNLIIRGIVITDLSDSITAYECSISDEYRNSKVPVIYNTALLIISICNITIVIILYSFIGKEIFRHFSFLKSLRYVARNEENKSEQISTVTSSKYSIEKEIHDFSNMGTKGDNREENRNKTNRMSSKSVISEKQSYKSTKIAIMITIFFILSYVPSLSENIVEDIYGEKYLSKFVSVTVLNILQKMFAINHAINPFIYGFIDKTFRNDCKEIWKFVFFIK